MLAYRRWLPRMIEKQIDIVANGNKLSGTICLPDDKGRFPFVLMVHGSGPLDRDENMKGQKLNVFNSFAHHIANEGIASLRYDKRGCGKSAGDYYTAGHSDFVEDAIAWFDTLVQVEVCKPNEIYVLGHSEGAIIAPQMSIKRPSIAGIILLCPFVQKMESVLISQAEHIQEAINDLKGVKGLLYRTLSRLAGNPIASQKKLIQRLKLSDSPILRYWFRKIPGNWLRELLQLAPEEIFRKVTCPVLLVGGQKDIQCDPADVDRIAEITNCALDAHVVRDLTHILRFDECKPSIFRYRELIKKPVEPTVLNLVSNWLKR